MASEREEKAFGSFRDTFERVSSLKFFFRYVSTPFDHTASFSSVTFQLQPYTVDNGSQKARLALELSLNELQLQHIDHLKFIQNCRQHAWPPFCSKVHVKVMCC